jgi:hypothetical protein
MGVEHMSFNYFNIFILKIKPNMHPNPKDFLTCIVPQAYMWVKLLVLGCIISHHDNNILA